MRSQCSAGVMRFEGMRIFADMRMKRGICGFKHRNRGLIFRYKKCIEAPPDLRQS